jgi:hypothetical protein
MPISRQLRIALAVLVCGIAAHALGFLGDSVPTLRSPYPIVLTVIMFFGVPVFLPAALMGSVFFLSSKRALSAAPAFSWGAALSLSLRALLQLLTILPGGTTVCSTKVDNSFWYAPGSAR